MTVDLVEIELKVVPGGPVARVPGQVGEGGRGGVLQLTGLVVADLQVVIRLAGVKLRPSRVLTSSKYCATQPRSPKNSE